MVFNPETSACDQPESVPGCEDTYVKSRRFKNEAGTGTPQEESRTAGGHKAAANTTPDISSGEFSGFLALLKENGLLKPGALKALNAAMVDDASSSSSTSKTGLIHRDSRLTDGRSMEGFESEERSLVLGDGEEDEDSEDTTERDEKQPPAAKTSRLQTLFARRAQQKEKEAAAAASSSSGAPAPVVLPRLKVKVSSSTAAVENAADEVEEPPTRKKKKKKVQGGSSASLLLKEEEMGKVMAAVLKESEDETMKKIVKAILGRREQIGWK